MTTEEKLLSVIDQIRVNKQLSEIKTITEHSNLRNDIGFTSFDLAELTVLLEDEFGIDIFADGIVSTVGEILRKLQR